jgi:hypothetical protein
MGALEAIRAACAAVARQARHVKVADDRLAPYARSLPLAQAVAPTLDPAHHFLGPEADTVAFVLALDAVNFGSGYFPHLAKLPGLSGYFTVATRLTERFRRSGPLSATELAAITPEECTALFEQERPDSVVSELMEKFARAWNDLGRLVLERFDGDPCRLVSTASGSAERLLGILAAMPFYRDVADYQGLAVPFYKRAQLTAADLHLALGGKGLGHFDDLEELTIFADNLVPHVLRLDGVLVGSTELVARIEAGELVPAGSDEEIELRATAVHAVELIRTELTRRGTSVSSMQLDYLLWNRGQRPEYKARPRHRTRTVYY